MSNMKKKKSFSVNSSIETQDSTSLAISQITADCSLSLSNENLMQSGRTDKFISYIDKGTKLNKKSNKIERKQLQHDLQLLKIKLSQKSLIIENLKNEHMNQLDEFEDKLRDVLFKKERLQSQLANAEFLLKAEVLEIQEKTKNDLKGILEKQEELEKANKMLQEQISNSQAQIESADLITKEKYIDLKSIPTDTLSIGQFFSLKLYECMESVLLECKNQIKMKDKFSSDVVKLSNTLHETEHDLINERRERTKLDNFNRSQEFELKELRKQLNTNLEKLEYVDIVKAECNKLEEDCSTLAQSKVCLHAEILESRKDNAKLINEIQTVQKDLHFLKQDKENLSRNITELKMKLKTSEDNLQRANQQIKSVNSSREELFEKYASSREEARTLYEQQLQREISKLKIQTEKELDKVRINSKEAYERENRTLREARDAAVLEKDHVNKQKNEAERLCKSFSNQIRILESNLDFKVSELQSSANVKSFELDRLHLFHDETCKSFDKYVQMDNEIKAKTLQLVTEDFSELQRKSSLIESHLGIQINKLINKLEVYENLEKETDNIVMQNTSEQDEGADCSCVNKAEKLLSYRCGANNPVTAKMKQTIQLVKKILNLEKLNSSYCKEKEVLRKEVRELRGKLKMKEKMLDETNQPISYILEGMKRRDEDIEKVHKEKKKMGEKIDMLKKDNVDLEQAKRQLTLDLDKLLSHREEIEVIKNVLIKMANDVDLRASSSTKKKLRKNVPHVQISSKEESSEKKLNDPMPVVFTKEELSSIKKYKYNNLKKLHQT